MQWRRRQRRDSTYPFQSFFLTRVETKEKREREDGKEERNTEVYSVVKKNKKKKMRKRKRKSI